MKRVLITGMSGTGKSTLLDELGRRGFPVVDTDVGGYIHRVGDEYLWRGPRIEELLSRTWPAGVVFVQGTVRNQVAFYPRFDHIVLLSAPQEVLLSRLQVRTDNPYGKTPAEVAEVLDNLRHVEPLLRAAASLEIVTTSPVDEIADAVLAHVGCN